MTLDYTIKLIEYIWMCGRRRCENCCITLKFRCHSFTVSWKWKWKWKWMDCFECENSRMAKRTYSHSWKVQRNSIKQTQSLLLCGNIKFRISATNHSGAWWWCCCRCSFELKIIWFYMMRFHLHSHLQSINVLNFDSLISCCFSFVSLLLVHHCHAASLFPFLQFQTHFSSCIVLTNTPYIREMVNYVDRIKWNEINATHHPLTYSFHSRIRIHAFTW